MANTPSAGKARLWRWASLGCGAAVLLLLPVDAYGTNVPTWLMMLLCGVLALCIVMLWRQDGGRRWFRFLAAAAAAAVIVLVSYSCFFYPYWNSVSNRTEVDYTRSLDTVLTQDEARDDITYAYRTLLKTHPALLGFVPEDFAQAAEEAHETVRSSKDGLTAAEVARLVERMASVLGDAHTGIGLRNLEDIRYLPTSGVHARRGDVLVAVNGTSVADMAEQMVPLLSAETPGWAELLLQDYLVTDAGLAFLGLPLTTVEYTYETPDGEQLAEEADVTDFVPLGVLRERTEEEFPAEDSAWVSYDIDEDHSLAVLTLDQCVNTAEYLACLHDMFTEVKERGIRNVAVDLRENGGGDSSVATEFIKYLDTDSYAQMGLKLRNGAFLIEYPGQTVINNRYADLTFDGDVYILTSPATFSSAMLFTEYITDNGLGTQVGEAPGNIADGYGEVVTFQLPNSGLLLGVSSKQFERIGDGGSLLEPDIAAPADSALDVLREKLSGHAAQEKSA